MAEAVARARARGRALGGVLAAALVASAGCSTQLGRFTILSTKNVELSRVDLKRIGLRRGVVGTAGRLWFLIIPFGFAPKLEDAVDECLELAHGDFLVNARVEYFTYTGILFTWEGYRVTGDAGESIGFGSRDMDGPPPGPWSPSGGSPSGSGWGR